MIIYIRAFFSMVWNVISDLYSFLYYLFFENFFDDPARTVLITVLCSLFSYFKYFYPGDPRAPAPINILLIPLLVCLISAIGGLIIYGILMGIKMASVYFKDKFDQSLKQQRMAQPVQPIETNVFFKKQMAIIIKRIKKRTPEKPNQRLDSVE